MSERDARRPPIDPPPLPDRQSEPSSDGGAVLSLQQIRRLRWVANFTVVALVMAGAVLLFTIPRSIAYRGLLDENMALRERLLEVDRRTTEMEGVLKRLRLYDAQLRSLSEADGDHGPLPDEVFANYRLVEAYTEIHGEFMPMVGEESAFRNLMVDDLRPAESWAMATQARAESYLDVFEMVEFDLTQLMSDLETIRALDSALPSWWPANGSLSSGYGWRRSPIDRTYTFHSGIDIANSRGTPIDAAAAGVVTIARDFEGYGRMVEIDHGFGITTIYAHCTSLKVEEGEQVERGDYIATIGSTGRTTGPHLHFEVRIDGHSMDPLDFLPR